MPKGLHDKIKQNVKKAHPNYSGARQEQETNAVLATIAKNKMKRGKRGGIKKKAGGARKKR